MDFARKEMEKYGWKEGKGLGKDETGTASALKTTLKFDNAGLGHDVGKDFTNRWWENVYDKASNNIVVQENHKNDNVQMMRVGDEVEITTKSYSVKEFKKSSTLQYGSFLKTSTITQDGIVDANNVVTPDDVSKFTHKEIDDDELFKICGGRTAHKGARHGLKLSGKLSRVEKQEKILLKKLRSFKVGEVDLASEYQKKLKIIEKLIDFDVKSTPTEVSKEKKKKRKKRKSVSFSETVLEYSSSNPENIQDVSVNELQIKDKEIAEDPVTTDEGIEPDTHKGEKGCGQECFSEMQVRKKGKKKKSKTVVEANDDSNMSDNVEIEIRKRKKKRRRAEDQIDIDRVKKIKRNKRENKDIVDISDTLEECRISE